MAIAVFQVEEVSLNDTDLDDVTFSGVEVEGAEIHIPREVLRGNPNPVRMASLLFRNMSGLLPARLEGNNNDGYSYIFFGENRVSMKFHAYISYIQ